MFQHSGLKKYIKSLGVLTLWLEKYLKNDNFRHKIPLFLRVYSSSIINVLI